MRRHFSFQRFAIVVVWAALSPQGALLVQSWTGLLLGTNGFDTASVAGDFDSGWQGWSDRLGTISKQTAAKNAAAKNRPTQNAATENTAARDRAAAVTLPAWTVPAALDQPSTEHASAPGEFSAAAGVAAGRFSSLLPIDNRRDLNLSSVVIR